MLANCRWWSTYHSLWLHRMVRVTGAQSRRGHSQETQGKKSQCRRRYAPKPLRLRKVLLVAWDMQGGSLMSLSEMGQAAVPRDQGAN